MSIHRVPPNNPSPSLKKTKFFSHNPILLGYPNKSKDKARLS